jgi:hypothetical protein
MRLIVLLVVGLCTFAAGAALGAAQAPNVRPVFPRVMSGEDLGFRVEGRKGDIPVGSLVVRVNGEWVEVQFATGVKWLTK